MKILADEEGKKAIDSVIETGMRKGAWGSQDLIALATIQQTVQVILQPSADDDEDENRDV